MKHKIYNIKQEGIILKKIGALLLIVAIFFQPLTANAASSMKIRYNGTTKTYTDKQIKVTYNGEKVALNKTPGILIGGNGMLPYEEVFVKSNIKAKATYNKSTKKITIISGKNKVVMKLGSKTASVNGKTKKMPAAPLQVKYLSTGKTKIVVPSRFVAENLGFLYYWYSKTGTVAIEKKGLMIEYSDKQYNYQGSQVTFYVDGEKINTKLPGFLSKGYTLAPAQEVYSNSNLNINYSYDEVSQELVLSTSDKIIKLTMGSQEAYVNDELITLPTAPLEVLYLTNNQTYIMIPAEFVTQSLGLYYEYDESTKAANISSLESEQETNPEDLINEIRMSKGSNALTNVVTYDDYWNRRYVLTLPGNQVAYYTENIPVVEDSSRAKVTVSLNNEGNTDIIIKTNIIRGFEVVETDSEIIVTVKAPKDIYSNIVMVDAGHGGSAKGAQGANYGNTLVEKEVTLAIVKELKLKADQNNDNIKFYYTRLEDSTITNAERAKMTNEMEADIFLSVHINAHGEDPTIRGSEVLYSSKFNQQAKSSLTSSKLAYAMKATLVDAVGSKERSIIRSNIEVLNSTNMPSALLEVAFLSNEEDVEILEDSNRIARIGEGIYEGIVDIFNIYQTKR